jgi:hypothetical protein
MPAVSHDVAPETPPIATTSAINEKTASPVDTTASGSIAASRGKPDVIWLLLPAKAQILDTPVTRPYDKQHRIGSKADQQRPSDLPPKTDHSDENGCRQKSDVHRLHLPVHGQAFLKG